MDCQRFEGIDLLMRFRESARRGDWMSAAEFADALSSGIPPADREQLGIYLGRMREALMVAKASRADLSVALARINAAAGFSTNAAPAPAPGGKNLAG
jgi:hypothetical protein